MAKKKYRKDGFDPTIAVNRKAFHEFEIHERLEAGIDLRGWEVKSLRAGRGQLQDSYVLVRGGEVWMINCHITPLDTVSTHFEADPKRARKLLLKSREIRRLIGATQHKGYTLVPLKLYWCRNLVKVQIAYARGKQKHDKRETERRREWQRHKERLLKNKMK
jgi:SsrA-binding protein